MNNQTEEVLREVLGSDKYTELIQAIEKLSAEEQTKLANEILKAQDEYNISIKEIVDDLKYTVN